jgi:GNAT superfamily N-acetyltransferase
MPEVARAAPTELRFVAVGQEDPLAEPLLAELAVEYATRYGATEEAVSKWLRGYPADEFAPPGGGLLIGLLDGRPVTGGAFRRFDDTTAELKRIWTDSGYRRQGRGRALLAELETAIAARGYRRVYLTTGDRQPEAEALYLSTGYMRLDGPLPAEGEVYPLAFEKMLA